MRAALARFRDLWKTLETPKKARLVRLVVRQVTYDGRDNGEGKIAWRLQPFTDGAATTSDDRGFEHGNDWRGGRGSNPWPPA